MKATLTNAAALVTSYIRAGIAVNVLGSPGIGKSDLVKSVAKSLNAFVIDFRLSTADPTDLTGLPFIKDGRSVFLPNEAFPIKGDALPDGYDCWVLFLDEITNAPMAVQAAAYKLILDRQVGKHDLHEKVHIVSAGNLISDAAAVTGEMSTALKSRMAHINIQMSLESWMDWALDANVSHEITSYLKFKPDELYRFDPKSSADTFPCPRTWGMVDKVIKQVGINSDICQDMIAGAISDGVATNFMNFCKHFTNLPTYDQIIKDPKGVDVPKELATLYALSGSIGAQTKRESIEEVMEYVARMPAEFQLRTFTDFTKRDPTLVTNPKVRDWLKTNAKKMIN